MRKAALLLYETEIEAIYAAIEKSAEAGHDVPMPATWDAEGAQRFVHEVVMKGLDRRTPLSDEVDLFQNGIDSLKATYLRNSIAAVLRVAQGDRVARLPGDFVFAHPTVQSLSSAISQRIGGLEGAVQDQTSLRIRAMGHAVQRYTKDLPAHTPDASYPAPKDDEEVVVLTGSTGGLGSHLLAQLIEMRSVMRVYALNRDSAIPLAEFSSSIYDG
ncbi:hypothetical protein FRB94_004592 [Tulasnella sp. JGI-2019a]|nr:hypothetical protein FRB93_011341 [Tulasnella sp. JGI-2019a]KAG8984638.1 hypothetical protein FRB94_004592 [Tulasnella sp. JGI-2019a]